MTVKLTLEFPDTPLGDENLDEQSLAREVLLAALVKWYEQGRVSSGWAAAAAGVSRAEFLDILARFGVTAIQSSPQDVITDAHNARQARL